MLTKSGGQRLWSISSILPKPYENSQEGGITPKWKVIRSLTEVALELAIEERMVLDSRCHTPGKHWLIFLFGTMEKGLLVRLQLCSTWICKPL